MLKKSMLLLTLFLNNFLYGQIQIQAIETAEIPNKCFYEGNILKAYYFMDNNGTNYLLYCMNTISVQNEYHDIVSKELKVYHYKKTNANECVLLRRFYDFQFECEFDNLLNVIADTITDIDKNGLAEIIFMYTNSCQSDASPIPLKLMFTENGNKYAFRGYNQMGPFGGEITDNKDFNNAPTIFEKFCREYWEKNKAK